VKPQPNYRYGALAKFAKLTTGAEKGAVTDLNLDV
jgi:dihydroxy-acid dehydratase